MTNTATALSIDNPEVRKAFEASMGARNAHLLGRNEQGDYLGDEIEEMWSFWKKAVSWCATQVPASTDHEVQVAVLELGGIHEGEFESNDVGLLHETVDIVQQQLVRHDRNYNGTTLMLYAKVPAADAPAVAEGEDPLHGWYPQSMRTPDETPAERNARVAQKIAEIHKAMPQTQPKPNN